MSRTATTPGKALASTPPEAAGKESKSEQALLDTHFKMLVKIEAEYGDGTPFDLSDIAAKLAALRDKVTDSLFQMGRLFLRIKANVPGKFGETLDAIGIDPRFAQKAMQGVLKYSKSDAKKALQGQVSSSKLMELVVLDDETLEHIAEGSLTELPLDDLQRMGMQELRKKVRDLRAKLTDEEQLRDKLVGEREDKIRTLEVDVARAKNLAKKSTERERAEDMLAALDQKVIEHMSLIHSMEAMHSDIVALYVGAKKQVDADIDERLEQAAMAVQKRIAPYLKQAGV